MSEPAIDVRAQAFRDVNDSWLAFFGSNQTISMPGKQPQDVWYQNATFVYVPFVLVGAVLVVRGI